MHRKGNTKGYLAEPVRDIRCCEEHPEPLKAIHLFLLRGGADVGEDFARVQPEQQDTCQGNKLFEMN